MNLVTLPTELSGEHPHALGRPQQHPHRIATTVLGDEPLQRHNQTRIVLGDRLATAPASTHPPILEPLTRVDLPDPLADRVLRDPARPRDRRDPPTTQQPRLRRRPKPPRPLVQLRRQRPEPLTDQPLIDHTPGVLRHRTTILHIIYLPVLSRCSLPRPTKATPAHRTADGLPGSYVSSAAG